MSDTALPSSGAPPHPVGLVVTDDLQRSRLTVFFRLLLAIPHLLWLALWGIVAELALLVAWFVAVFTGRLPDGLHGVLASVVRYSVRVSAYIFLLADPFPPFGSGGTYPVDLRIDPPEPQSRLTVFFRLIL